MIGLSDRHLACLQEVVSGPGGLPGRPGEAWAERQRLVWLFGEEVVSSLVASGWLAEWPELASVTLTPAAADVLRVRIEDRYGDDVQIWVPATDPERPYRLPRHQERLPCLDQLPDPRSRAKQLDDFPRLSGGLGRRLEYLRSRIRQRKNPRHGIGH